MAAALKRAWQMALWRHAILLGVVLVLAFLATKPLLPYSADEGVAIMQARQLNDSGQWLVSQPSLDPDGLLTVPYLGERGEKGKAFYAKHPFYPLLLAAVDRPFGVAGMVALSTAAALVAAFLSALLTRTLGSRHERVALWLVGLGSPMFLYANVVVAHTLAAAFSVAAVLLVVAALRAISRKHYAGYLIAAGVSCALVSALRSEGVFLSIGLAAALLLRARLSKTNIGRHLVLAAGVLFGSGLAIIGDKISRHAITGDVLPYAATDIQTRGFIEGRLVGFLTTWFGSSNSPAFVTTCLALACIGVLIAAFGARKGDSPICIIGWVVATVAYLVSAFGAGSSSPSGLMLVFPVGWFAILLIKRATCSDDKVLVIVTVAVAASGVLATQYYNGGGLEWGGRYFLFILPIAVAVLIGPLCEAVALMQRKALIMVVALMVISTGTVSGMALHIVHDRHAVASKTTDRIKATLADLRAEGDTPYVVVDPMDPQLVQMFWPAIDTRTWLVPNNDRFISTVHRISAAQIATVVLITDDPDEASVFASTYAVKDQRDISGRMYAVVMIRKSA